MEKQNKVMSIIVSCVSFLVVLLFLVGIFAGLPQFSVSGASEGASAYSLIDQMIETIKNMAGAEGGMLGQLVGRLLTYVAFVVIFAIFGIMGLVKGIILVVKSIKALSKPEENKPAIKPLVSYGDFSLIYVTLVLGIFYEKRDFGLMSYTTTIGAGAVMVLIAGLLALCAAGAYVFVARKEEKLLNKIFDMSTSCLAIVGLMLMLFAPVGSDAGKAGLIAVLANRFGDTVGVAASGGAPEYLALIMTILGSVLFFVAIGFVKAVIVNGFRLEEKEGLDYPKSSIVKSALWLGFALVGSILLFAFVEGLGIAVGSVMTLVFAALALGCAIVNKVMSSKESK